MTTPLAPITGGYISLPITIDPNILIQQAFAAISAQYPGWVPREGHLEVAIIEEAAQMVAVAASVASQVPVEIFEAFGQLVGVDPILGAFATVPATFTMTDDAGYTISAGTVVAYPLSGNAQILFSVRGTAVIPEGETTGDVVLICETVGSFPNGLATATCQLVTTFAQVASVVTTDEPSGGVDAETSTSYANRLSNELQLMAPRPILPGDFAILAANVTGVFRALALDGVDPGSTVTDGVTTMSSLNIGSATAHFETGVWVGRTVHDSAGHIPAGAQVASVTSDSVAVLNASHAATASGTGDTLTFGDLTSQERCITVCGVDDTGAALSTPVNEALQAYLESLREVNFLVFTIDPTYTEIDVSVTCSAVAGADTGTVQSAVGAALAALLNPATWGGGAAQTPRWDASANVVGILEVANAILATQGVLYIASGDLEICIHGGSLGTTDVTMAGDAPLPTAGTITVTVT